jgi:hypothetical protein
MNISRILFILNLVFNNLGEFMNQIIRISLVLVMFSILYVSAASSQVPGMTAPGSHVAPMGQMGDPCMNAPAGPDRDNCYSSKPPMGAPGMTAPGSHVAPMGQMGDPCMNAPAGPDRDNCYSSKPPMGAPGYAPGTAPGSAAAGHKNQAAPAAGKPPVGDNTGTKSEKDKCIEQMCEIFKTDDGKACNIEYVKEHKCR